MAYHKLLIHVWCDWDPSNSDLEEIGRQVTLREGAICSLREIIEIVDRPEDIENKPAMIFFGGDEGGRRPQPRIRVAQDREAVMRFNKFSFGTIEMDGSTYEHDVIIDRGEVRRRKKKPSKQFRNEFG